MDDSMDNKYAKLEVALEHRFTNKALLEEAMCHPSAQRRRGVGNASPYSYERLEFLGDSVLGMLVSELLYNSFPGEQEGALAKRKAALVCGESLSECAHRLELGRYMELSESEELSGGRGRKATLENSFEALIAALYLDGGMEAVRHYVVRVFRPMLSDMKTPPKDPKTTLQEWAQARGMPLPEYKVTAQDGPPHAPTFTIEVSLNSNGTATGTASSKKRAERLAAEEMLKAIA